ncbi:hypothetical protein BZA05DRAFT_399491 [Tricharina praecox]|uniref:uncharacterized protein n=1 Tax=Tricharina praecox TaxID=43433 RepID=UPI00221ECCC4|nr:uncharacterized protein BZA05DRAFT_399491 [Tricharina praecox]KAI5851024.1 hypothetical protein BZA05DRAFT_399491 [Tricharina praecox]
MDGLGVLEFSHDCVVASFLTISKYLPTTPTTPSKFYGFTVASFPAFDLRISMAMVPLLFSPDRFYCCFFFRHLICNFHGYGSEFLCCFLQIIPRYAQLLQDNLRDFPMSRFFSFSFDLSVIHAPRQGVMVLQFYVLADLFRSFVWLFLLLILRGLFGFRVLIACNGGRGFFFTGWT